MIKNKVTKNDCRVLLVPKYLTEEQFDNVGNFHKLKKILFSHEHDPEFQKHIETHCPHLVNKHENLNNLKNMPVKTETTKEFEDFLNNKTQSSNNHSKRKRKGKTKKAKTNQKQKIYSSESDMDVTFDDKLDDIRNKTEDIQEMKHREPTNMSDSDGEGIEFVEECQSIIKKKVLYSHTRYQETKNTENTEFKNNQLTNFHRSEKKISLDFANNKRNNNNHLKSSMKKELTSKENSRISGTE
ncbi:hypothetical protein M0813_05957 [Anaeramoeba flamelloides]|uniref:Uncharacterized protein n=1 Tax=Anaeramoeba flamelloides TaxID=1746091 RepID=A0ABQ8XHF2_9EUKA|nr:hypothetical protein M0813_05957 [Anaeramoeba flamelloides]